MTDGVPAADAPKYGRVAADKDIASNAFVAGTPDIPAAVVGTAGLDEAAVVDIAALAVGKIAAFGAFDARP